MTSQSFVAEMPRSFGFAPALPMAVGYRSRGGLIDLEAVAGAFRMSKRQLAETLGLAAVTLTKSDRANSAKTQSRASEMLEILARIDDWAGGPMAAMAWYRAQPIPALDGRTAESLVKSGQAAAVRDYLDHVALGGFA
jgi:hypothetical protein